MTLMPFEVSRGVSSMQSTGQKLMQASQPVQLSGMTTAISLGLFFFRVIFAGASGMMDVGLAFFASYAMNRCAPQFLQSERDCITGWSVLDCGVLKLNEDSY